MSCMTFHDAIPKPLKMRDAKIAPNAASSSSETRGAAIFPHVSLALNIPAKGNTFAVTKTQVQFERNKSNFAVSTVSADGLAPLGARPSAGSVMTDPWFRMYTSLTLQGWIYIS